jgi:hypothetical protein
VWLNAAYELIDGRFVRTFTLAQSHEWHVADVTGAGDDAILVETYRDREHWLTLAEQDHIARLLVRRNAEPVVVAKALGYLQNLTRGPTGSVLARQVGPRPQHLGCIFWPEVQTRGTVIWIDDDLFPDESPDEIRSLHWSEPAQRLIAQTDQRLWAVPAERVLALPRYDAATGRKRRG